MSEDNTAAGKPNVQPNTHGVEPEVASATIVLDVVHGVEPEVASATIVLDVVSGAMDMANVLEHSNGEHDVRSAIILPPSNDISGMGIEDDLDCIPAFITPFNVDSWGNRTLGFSSMTATTRWG